MLNAAAAPLWMTQAIRCENALKKKQDSLKSLTVIASSSGRHQNFK